MNKIKEETNKFGSQKCNQIEMIPNMTFKTYGNVVDIKEFKDTVLMSINFEEYTTNRFELKQGTS